MPKDMIIEIGDLAVAIHPATNGASKVTLQVASTGPALTTDTLDDLQELMEKKLVLPAARVECKTSMSRGSITITADPYRPEGDCPSASIIAEAAQKVLGELRGNYSRDGSLQNALDRMMQRRKTTAGLPPVVSLSKFGEALIPQLQGLGHPESQISGVCMGIAKAVLALPLDDRNNPDAIRPLVEEKLTAIFTPRERATEGVCASYIGKVTEAASGIMTEGIGWSRRK